MRSEADARAFLQTLYAERFGGAAPGQASAQSGNGTAGLVGEAASKWSGNAVADATSLGAAPTVFASAPGRVELAGNHTDHQGGRTIAAGIDRRAYALAAPNGTDVIRVYMDGFGEASLSVSDLDPRPEEQGKPISLIRGLLAAYARSGKSPCGFDMVTCSDIPVGRGLSSSAAFEVLTGTVIRALDGADVPASPDETTALALESVWVEQTYFGKPCGAQDQLASAFGGIAALDFSGETPLVSPLDFDIDAHPYSAFLVDSRGDHSDLTDEYAAIPADMQAVAHCFDCALLEEVPYPAFLEQLPRVRSALGDRAVLRAIHYFEETRRAQVQAEALRSGDFEAFLEHVRLSGASSAQFLQNVSPRSDGSDANQPAMVVLALCAHLLDGGRDNRESQLPKTAAPEDPTLFSSGNRGAYRIHGGGFGGSILAFVPDRDADAFQTSMDALLGYSGCMSLAIGGRGAYAERLA